MERWKTIVVAPDYSVSDHGRVRRDIPDWQGKYAGRVLSPSVHRGGYSAVTLCTPDGKITRKVHRLVCEAFNGPPPVGKPHCAHRDGDPSNNRPDNLYWATAKENCDDRERHGRTYRSPNSKDRQARKEKLAKRGWRGGPRNGALNANAKLTEKQVAEIKAAKYYFGMGADFARKFGVSNGLITAIRKGRAWRHARDPDR